MWNIQTNERVWKAFSKIKFVKRISEVEALFWTFDISFGVILEIMDIKYRLHSKHLFQRTQKLDGYEKPLCNHKFV